MVAVAVAVRTSEANASLGQRAEEDGHKASVEPADALGPQYLVGQNVQIWDTGFNAQYVLS